MAKKQTDFRVATATAVYDLSSVTRLDIFGSLDKAYMPLHLQDDAKVMIPPFVGRRYKPARGLLLLGINPGGGGDAQEDRTAEEEKQFPMIERFYKSSDAERVEAFEIINGTFPSIVRGWNLWRILVPTLEAAGRSLDEVALWNLVPYRTRSNKQPPVTALDKSWQLFVQPMLALLRPSAIVALGKKAGTGLDRQRLEKTLVYCVPRTNGDWVVSADAITVHDRMKKELRRRRRAV